MQNDRLVISEAPELTNKVQIPERLWEGHAGDGHDAHHAWPRPLAASGTEDADQGETRSVNSQTGQTALQNNFNSHGMSHHPFPLFIVYVL
jgi:hypothetical protein